MARIWPTLIKKTAYEGLFLGLACAALLAIMFFPTFNNELQSTNENKSIPGRLDLSQRLGYAVLLNAGFVDFENITEEQRSERIHQLQLPWPVQARTSSPLYDCISDSSVDFRDETLHIRTLGLSIIATEIYNRDWLMRQLEFLVGRGYSVLFGIVPDLSYGVGQVRISRARDVLAHSLGISLSDDDIFTLLQSDCDNARIASTYIAEIVKDLGKTIMAREAVAKTATAYIGAKNQTGPLSIYLEAVAGAYNLIANEAAGTFKDVTSRSAATQNNAYLCISFERGDKSGQSDIFKQMIQDSHAAKLISVGLWTEEKEPLKYAEALRNARHEWIKEELHRMGLISDTIQISDFASLDQARTFVESYEEDCSGSFAVIEVNLPIPQSNDTAAEPSPNQAKPSVNGTETGEQKTAKSASDRSRQRKMPDVIPKHPQNQGSKKSDVTQNPIQSQRGKGERGITTR